MMTKDLDRLREIFLADDVDAETRADNEAKIREWESSLIASEDFASWQEHDVTKSILAKARETYRDTIVALGTNKTVTQPARDLLFAKQDAALWLISIIAVDAKGALEQINRDIAAAVAAAS